MPFLLRPSQQSCDDFMSRPNTHYCHFPTGRDFYFSLPFDSNWLCSLRPQELEALGEYLSGLLHPATGMDLADVSNVVNILKTIRYIFEGVMTLPNECIAAWENGHGYPDFDLAFHIVGFFMEWDKVDFYRQMNNPTKDRTQIRVWEKNGNEAYEHLRNGVTKEFHIYGGVFPDVQKWCSFADTLSDSELLFLDIGWLIIEDAPNGGWRTALGSPYLKEHNANNKTSNRPHTQNESSRAVRQEDSSHTLRKTSLAPPDSRPCEDDGVCATSCGDEQQARHGQPRTVRFAPSQTQIPKDTKKNKTQVLHQQPNPTHIITIDANGRIIPGQVPPLPQVFLATPSQAQDWINPYAHHRSRDQDRISRGRSPQSDEDPSPSTRLRPAPRASSTSANPPSEESSTERAEYQAYAEDSQEEEVRPAPRSWRDV